MKSDGSKALDEVRAFLAERILPGVADELRGELRAAIKLLADASRELVERPTLLAGETDELEALCRRTRDLLGDVARDREAPRAEAERLLVMLQRAVRSGRDGRDLLDEFLATLGRHAECESRWQSVFPGASPADGEGDEPS